MNMYTVVDLVHIVTHGKHDTQGVIISLQGYFIKAGKTLSLEILSFNFHNACFSLLLNSKMQTKIQENISTTQFSICSLSQTELEKLGRLWRGWKLVPWSLKNTINKNDTDGDETLLLQSIPFIPRGSRTRQLPFLHNTVGPVLIARIW